MDLPIGQGLARDRTLDCLIRIGLVMDGLIDEGKVSDLPKWPWIVMI